MYYRLGLAAVVLVGLVFPGERTLADDWPQWLGPQRDGHWRETGILTSFPDAGPRVLWRQDIGGGYAGPAVAEGRVFVLDRQPGGDDPATVARLTRDYGKVPNQHYERGVTLGNERILCLSASTGKVLWEREYDCPYTIATEYATGPRATPTVDGGKVYALGAEGNLRCFDAATGDVHWQRDWKKDYGLEVPTWGTSSPPLVDGRKLLCVVGGDGTTAVAFDKDTGAELWRALSSKAPGYAAPVIYRVGGRRQLVIWHGEAVNGLDPETGKVYWSVPVETWAGMAIATPRLAGDFLFVTGFRQQSTLLRLASEPPTATVAWRGGAKVGVSSTLTTPWLEDGHIYAGGQDGRYTCARLADGARLWTSYAPSTGDRRASWASVFTIKHEDKFFLVNDSGDLIVARLSPRGYQEVSRARILEATTQLGRRTVVWSHPAFAQRCVFARNDREIVCVSLAETESP